MRIPGMIAVAMVVAGLLGACSSGSSPAPASSRTGEAMTVTVDPSACDSPSAADRVYRVNASGLTPGGEYVTSAIDPAGRAVEGITNPGRATTAGNVSPGWSWPCATAEGMLTEPGEYLIYLTDFKTGRSVRFSVIVRRG